MTVGVDCSRIELTLTLTRTPTQECLAGVGIDCSWIKRADAMHPEARFLHEELGLTS